MSKLALGLDHESFYKQVYLDYGKTKEDVEEYVDILLKWCQAQPHFPEVPTINAIRLFLAACKCSIERAKKKLDMYYTIRRLMPELFTQHPLNPEMILQGKILHTVLLPKPTSDHQRVFFYQLNPDLGPEDYKLELFVVQINHMIEVILQEDTCYRFILIVNCAHINMGFLSKVSPMIIKKCIVCLEKMYGNRVSKVYLINFIPFLENVLNTVIKPLLPAKIKGRINICENVNALLKDFDKSILPKDLGGDEKSVQELHAMLTDKYEELKPRFDKIQFMTVDESKRPDKLENDDILGYYGNFKTINVD